MKFELEPYNRNVPEAELLDDLRLIATRLGMEPITRENYEVNGGKYGSRTMENRFGSWNRALQRAELPVNQVRNIPEEELLENLESVWRRLGRQPRYDELRKPLSKFSVMPYQKRFGTYRKALEKFVSYANEYTPSQPSEGQPNLETRPTSAVKARSAARYIGWRTRFLVMRRDGYMCRYCGRRSPEVELHIDHVTAWSKGGQSTLDNLQTLCQMCNVGKGYCAAG